MTPWLDDGGVTLREHLEAIRDAHARAHPDSDWCRSGCGTSPYPCLASQHAVAALAIMDAAERDMFDHETGMIRIVPDYQPGVDQPHHAPGWTDPEPTA